MAIQILNDINQDIKRLYIAGSKLAKDDARLKKYTGTLDKLGEKAKVFAVLSDKIKKVVECESGKESQNLLETGMLIQSVNYTQVEFQVKEELSEVDFTQNKKVDIKNISYHLLSEFIELVEKQSQEHSDIAKELFERKLHNDERLYKYYIKAIKEKKSYISEYIMENIIPDAHESIANMIIQEIDIKGGKADVRLFNCLEKVIGKNILSLSEKILSEGSTDLLIEAVATLRYDSKYEEILLGLLKNKNISVQESALYALAYLKSEDIYDLLIQHINKPKNKKIDYLVKALSIVDNEKVNEAIFEKIKEYSEDYQKNQHNCDILIDIFIEKRNLKYFSELIDIIGSNIDQIPNDSKKNGYVYHEYRYMASIRKQIKNIEKIGNSDFNEKLYYTLKDSKNSDQYQMFVLQCELARKLFGEKEFFEKYNNNKEMMKLNPVDVLKSIYHDEIHQHVENDGYYVKKIEDDSEKIWDRRWASFILKHNKEYYYYQYQIIMNFLYNDDEEGWKTLFNKIIASVRKSNKTQNTTRRNWMPNFSQVIERYYKIDPNKAVAQGRRILKEGCSLSSFEGVSQEIIDKIRM